MLQPLGRPRLRVLRLLGGRAVRFAQLREAQRMKRAEGSARHTCGGFLRVINSRPANGYRIRRYECENCAGRITTVEIEMPEDFNPKAGIELEMSRVAQCLISKAPITALVRELKKRVGETSIEKLFNGAK